jgi:hypothetical protein
MPRAILGSGLSLAGPHGEGPGEGGVLPGGMGPNGGPSIGSGIVFLCVLHTQPGRLSITVYSHERNPSTLLECVSTPYTPTDVW